MVATTAATRTLPVAQPGALRLQDYITMDRANREWTNTLWHISNEYEAARNRIMSIVHQTENLTSENVDQSEAECLMRAAESITYAVINFTFWEISTYYFDLGPSENFMSRMAYDILRKRNEMFGFAAGFLLKLEQIENSSFAVGRCNSTHGAYVMNATTKQLLEAKHTMQRISECYMNLQTDIANNEDNLRLPITANLTAETYFRWETVTFSRSCISMA